MTNEDNAADARVSNSTLATGTKRGAREVYSPPQSLPRGFEAHIEQITERYLARHSVLEPKRPTAARYIGALVAVLLGTFLGQLLEPLLDATVPLLMAVLIAAWFSGLGPALLASVVATLAIDYFSTPPLYTLTVEPAHIPRLVSFAGVAVLVAMTSAGRRSAERSLKQTRDELDTKVRERTADLREQADLLNLTHDTIFVRDMDDRIRYWNRGAQELYGWTSDEASGKVSHELMQTEFPAPVREITADLLRTERWEGELVHRKRDGSPVIVSSRWSLQRGVDGHPIGILETNNDITERRSVEEALRVSEEQWRAVFENNPTMYFMVDPTGIVLSVNHSGASQLGYTIDELIGESVLKVFPNEEWDEVRHTLRRCLDAFGESATWEIRRIRRDGSLVWVRETARAMNRVGNSPVVLIACEDITARKQAEADLRESERRHRHIFQATGVSIWEEDFSRVKAAIDDVLCSGVRDFREYLRSSPEFIDRAIALVRVVDVNEATLKLFGARSKDELTSSLQTIFTLETRDVFAGELLAIAEGRPAFEGETELKKLNGERMVVLFSVSFPPPDAAYDAVLVSIMDITDRKRAEHELEELAGRLIHAQEQERRRIGRELHDHISQLLGLLTIRIDELRANEGASPALLAGLGELRQSTSEITDEIRGLSHRLHSSTLDYLGLVPALQNLVGEFSGRHGIAVNFMHDAVPARLPSEVALCLFRVTEESLTNIAKHSQARSACVQVKGGSEGLRLMIEDSGDGFDPDHIETRAGLGFVSMRERLRVLRGTVRVDSARSLGTRVEAWVPASGVAPEATCQS